MASLVGVEDGKRLLPSVLAKAFPEESATSVSGIWALQTKPSHRSIVQRSAQLGKASGGSSGRAAGGKVERSESVGAVQALLAKALGSPDSIGQTLVAVETQGESPT
jgi:hypothetical protein